MTDRASCWSVTINNPTVEEYQFVLPPRWKLQGQLEKGEEGTMHYQGMLITPQIRFSAVKKVFPRAHIEVARNKQALQKYVNKEETRVASVESIPTLFEYQIIIAKRWDWDDYDKLRQAYITKTNLQDYDEIAMRYIDGLVAEDIESGRRGAEFIAVNPMWRSSWKKFWRSIIKRNGVAQGQTQHGEAGTEGTPAEQVSEGGQWFSEGDQDTDCS